MKLYKEASLMMLPTSVKDGKLYSIFPQPKPLSGELVTNGTFDTDSNWVKGTGWTISGGVASYDGSSGTQPIKQGGIAQSGKIYKVNLNVVSNEGSGSNTIFLGGEVLNSSHLQAGSYTFFVTTSTTGDLNIFGRSGENFVIDNISVVEVDQAPADFDFSRGSNLAATRINEQGLIEKGRENLLLYSNQFDTTWQPIRATLNGGQSGYDGNNAWSLTSDNNSGSHYVRQFGFTYSGVQTISVYAKANGADFLLIGTQSGNIQGYFDLSTGNVGSTGLYTIDANMTDMGNGWYRCDYTFDGTITYLYLYAVLQNGSNVWQGDGTSGILIQDAQLEAGLVATDYIESGATTGKAGVLEDLPRLDWSGSCPSLLLEPQRSNLLTYSEALSNWTNIQNVTITDNDIISPDGSQNASRINETTDNSVHRIFLNPTVASAKHSFSVFLKKGTRKWAYLRLDGAATEQRTWFDLENGVLGTVNSDHIASIDDFGNGWYRCSVSIAGTTYDTTPLGIIAITKENNTQSYVGDVNEYIYAWGAQLEQGSYATSYIPTHGTSVTRSGDACFLQNADVYSSGEGTIFFEVGDYNTNTSASGFNKILVFDEVATSSLDNIIYFEEYAGDNTILIRKGGSTILQSTPSYQDLRGSKIAIKWSSEGAKLFIDGVLNNTYIGDASLDIQYFGFDNPYNGDIVSTIKMKQLVGFPTALSDNECINLTTI